jgi:hypothetical protein
MSATLLKRLDVDARTAFVLLREQLVFGLAWSEIYSANVTTALLTGNDGTCNSNEPQTFRSASASFNSGHIGNYLVLYDTHELNAGIHKIVGVVDANTIIVQGGVYGSQFATDVSISYRVVDPTSNTGNTEFTVQGKTGTAPIWYARFFQLSSDTRVIRVEVGPNGGFVGGDRTGTGDSFSVSGSTVTLTDSGASFPTTDEGRFITITGATTSANNGTFPVTDRISSTVIEYTNPSGVTEAFPGTWKFRGTWNSPVITDCVISQDSTADRWYIKFTDSNIIMWTEDNAGTGAYNVAYIGAGSPRRPGDDASFAVAASGPVTGAAHFLKQINSIGSAGGNPQTVYKAIVYGDGDTTNLFTNLPSSNFDLRNDSADIPVGCDAAGNEDDDRGILIGLQWISDQIAYKTFVDNGRRLLSLGESIAVEWDGSLAR